MKTSLQPPTIDHLKDHKAQSSRNLFMLPNVPITEDSYNDGKDWNRSDTGFLSTEIKITPIKTSKITNPMRSFCASPALFTPTKSCCSSNYSSMTRHSRVSTVLLSMGCRRSFVKNSQQASSGTCSNKKSNTKIAAIIKIQTIFRHHLVMMKFRQYEKFRQESRLIIHQECRNRLTDLNELFLEPSLQSYRQRQLDKCKGEIIKAGDLIRDKKLTGSDEYNLLKELICCFSLSSCENIFIEDIILLILTILRLPVTMSELANDSDKVKCITVFYKGKHPLVNLDDFYKWLCECISYNLFFLSYFYLLFIIIVRKHKPSPLGKLYQKILYVFREDIPIDFIMYILINIVL